MHMTGRYPDWWPGALRPSRRGWVRGRHRASDARQSAAHLLGPRRAAGSGAPARSRGDAIGAATPARGVADLDRHRPCVRHGGGGDVSVATSPSSATRRAARSGRARPSTGCGSTRSRRSTSTSRGSPAPTSAPAARCRHVHAAARHERGGDAVLTEDQLKGLRCADARGVGAPVATPPQESQGG